MRTPPVGMDLLSPRTAAVMRLLAVLAILIAIGCPLAWGVARLAIHGDGDPVVTVDGTTAEPALVELTHR